MDGTFCVYIHINKINGKKYIGITSKKPTTRWGKNGIGYKKSTYFGNAIQKYGWDNFEHVIYQTGLTKGQACGLEQQLICLFETQNPKKGYNISGGGESGSYIDGRTNNKDWQKHLREEEKKKPGYKERRHASEKRYYDAHVEECRAKGRENYYKNKDHYLEYAAKYKAEHAEEIKNYDNEHAKQYYQDHRQERIEYARKHREENREKINARRRELAALKREAKKQQEQNV